MSVEYVLKYAAKHVYTTDMLQKVIAGDLPSAGDYPDFMTMVKGLRCVFSYEEQPCGRCAHLSVSSLPGSMPSVKQVEMVMEEFGMGDDIHDCINVWIEESGGMTSANVLRLIE
jgi:hypothetical protein